MAKALKVVGIVVGVVAIVASAGTLLAPAVAAGSAAAAAGAAVTAGGFLGMSAATLATIGTVASLAAGVIGAATAIFMPKPSFSTGGNPLSFQTNPQSGLPYAIGRTRMSGLRIHAETYDGTAYKSEGKDDVLSFAVMLTAGGEIDSIEKFRADKEVVTFNPSTGMAIGTYSDWMAQKISLGLAGASALALAFGGSSFPGWTAAHKLSGITHALWDLRGDPKGVKFGAGVPEPEWIGKWVKVYDPRKDSTYPGGSGAHRALNEATYEWSANPALHALTWALGRWQNGKRTLGIGAPVGNIRIAEFVEAANVADANDWKCGGVEWSTDSKWAILKRMLQAGGAEPTMTGAMIGCRVNAPRVSVATVTGDDLLDGASFPMTRSRRDRFNTVIPRFRSENHDWEIISGSPISVPLYVTEDGGQRTKEIDFPLAQAETLGTGLTQIGELAAYEIVNSREAGPWRFTVGPKFIGVKSGDVVTLDVPDEGIDAQPVLIRSRSIDPATFKITFEVETETDAKHDFALGKTTTPPPSYTPTAPDLTPPQPNAALWSVAATYAAGYIPQLTITGACEFPGADAVVIEFKKVADANWNSLGKFTASEPTIATTTAVEGSTSYHARLAYQSGDRIGPWRVLGPVTTLANLAGNMINNLNARNDRNPAAIAAPTFGATPITHQSHKDGSATSVLRWAFSAGSEPDIDIFETALIEAATGTVQTIGTTPILEKRLPAVPNARVAMHTTAQDKFLTWGVRAIRDVDPDVWDVWAAANPTQAAQTTKPRIVSPWAQPTGSFNPYQPSANVSITGDISQTLGYAPILYRGDIVVRFLADWGLNVIPGQLFKYQFKRFKGSVDVSSSATWSVSGYHDVSIDGTGLLTINFYDAYDGYVVVRSEYEGIAEESLLPFECIASGPPLADGTHIAVAPTFGGQGLNSTTWNVYSGVLAVAAGATGKIDLALYAGRAAEGAGYTDIHYKIQRRTGGGSWVDVVASVPGVDVNFDARYPVLALGGGFYTFSSLTNGQVYEFQVLARREGGTATGRFISKIFGARGY